MRYQFIALDGTLDVSEEFVTAEFARFTAEVDTGLSEENVDYIVVEALAAGDEEDFWS